MKCSSEPKLPRRDFVQRELLTATSKIIDLYRLESETSAFRSAQYLFLWYASLADTEALQAAYELMCEDGACFEMPIDSNAVFGRIFISAIAATDPDKATQVYENLIKLYADPGEGGHIEQLIQDPRWGI